MDGGGWWEEGREGRDVKGEAEDDDGRMECPGKGKLPSLRLALMDLSYGDRLIFFLSLPVTRTFWNTVSPASPLPSSFSSSCFVSRV